MIVPRSRILDIFDNTRDNALTIAIISFLCAADVCLLDSAKNPLLPQLVG